MGDIAKIIWRRWPQPSVGQTIVFCGLQVMSRGPAARGSRAGMKKPRSSRLLIHLKGDTAEQLEFLRPKRVPVEPKPATAVSRVINDRPELQIGPQAYF